MADQALRCSASSYAGGRGRGLGVACGPVGGVWTEATASLGSARGQKGPEHHPSTGASSLLLLWCPILPSPLENGKSLPQAHLGSQGIRGRVEETSWSKLNSRLFISSHPPFHAVLHNSGFLKIHVTFIFTFLFLNVFLIKLPQSLSNNPHFLVSWRNLGVLFQLPLPFHLGCLIRDCGSPASLAKGPLPKGLTEQLCCGGQGF